MGYRSEVVLVVGKEVMPQFMVTMAKSPEARALCFAEATRHENYEEKGNMLFAWDGIKWYDSFEEIRAIEDFLDWCDSEDVPSQDAKGERVDGDECYRFVRIGEDMSDVEERGWAYSCEIGVRRELDY